MKTPRQKKSKRSVPLPELAELRARVAETDATLRAIRNGEVDAVMGASSQVFTLEGAGDAYRILIERMNEGALTLTADKIILYANECFARMVKRPLEQVTGSSFRDFLSEADGLMLRQLMKSAAKSGSKIQMSLLLADGSELPVQISIRELPSNHFNQLTIGMVVTDLTEARQNEEVLRNLTHRLMQAQEEEQKRISRDLHGVIAQTLTGINIRLAALNTNGRDRNISHTQRLVEKSVGIVLDFARDLRPTVLDDLGLIPALHSFAKLFSKRTHIRVDLKIFAGVEQLDIAKRTVLFRVAQEALNNVARHAKAGRVEVNIQKLTSGGVSMKIKDDGKSFNVAGVLKAKGRKRLGLLGMRERVEMVGGTFRVESAPGRGTSVEVTVPLAHPQKNAVKKSVNPSKKS